MPDLTINNASAFPLCASSQRPCQSNHQNIPLCVCNNAASFPAPLARVQDRPSRPSVSLTPTLSEQITRIINPETGNRETWALIKIVTAQWASRNQPLSQHISNEKIIDLLSQYQHQHHAPLPAELRAITSIIAADIKRQPHLYEHVITQHNSVKIDADKLLRNIIWNSLQKLIGKLLFALTSTQKLKALSDELRVLYSASMSPGKKIQEMADLLARASLITTHPRLSTMRRCLGYIASLLTEISGQWETLVAEAENFQRSQTLVDKLIAILSLGEAIFSERALQLLCNPEDISPFRHQLRRCKTLLCQLQFLQSSGEIVWSDWLRLLTGIPEMTTLLHASVQDLALTLAQQPAFAAWPLRAGISDQLRWLTARLADPQLRPALRPLMARLCADEAQIDSLFALFSLAGALHSYPADAALSTQLSWLCAQLRQNDITALPPLAWLTGSGEEQNSLKLLEAMICPTQRNVEAVLRQGVYALAPLLMNHFAGASLPAELLRNLWHCYQRASTTESWSEMFIRLAETLQGTLKHYAHSCLIDWLTANPLAAATLNCAREISALNSWESALRWFALHDRSSDHQIRFFYQHYLYAMLLLQVYQALRAKDHQRSKEALTRLAAQLKDHPVVERYPQLSRIIDLLPFIPLFRQAWQRMPGLPSGASWWEWSLNGINALINSPHPEFQTLGQWLTHKVEEWLSDALMQGIEQMHFPSLLPGAAAASASGAPVVSPAHASAWSAGLSLTTGVSLEIVGAGALVYALCQRHQSADGMRSPADRQRRALAPLPLLSGMMALSIGSWLIYRGMTRPTAAPRRAEEALPAGLVADITSLPGFSALIALTERDADSYIEAVTIPPAVSAVRAKRHSASGLAEKSEKPEGTPLLFYLHNDPAELLRTLFPAFTDEKSDASLILALIIQGALKHHHVIEHGIRKGAPDEKRMPYQGQVKFPLLAIEVIETLSKLIALQENDYFFTRTQAVASELKDALSTLFAMLSAQKYTALKKYCADHKQRFFFYASAICQQDFLATGYPGLIAGLPDEPLQQRIKSYVAFLYQKQPPDQPPLFAGEALLTHLAAQLVSEGKTICKHHLFISHSDLSYLQHICLLLHKIGPYTRHYIAVHRPHLTARITRLNTTLKKITAFYDGFYICQLFRQMDSAAVASAFAAPVVAGRAENDYQALAEKFFHFTLQRLNRIFAQRDVKNLHALAPFSEASQLRDYFVAMLPQASPAESATGKFLSGELTPQEGEHHAAHFARLVIQTHLQPTLMRIITALQQEQDPPAFLTQARFHQLFALNYPLLSAPSALPVGNMLSVGQQISVNANLEEQYLFYKLLLTNQRINTTVSQQLEKSSGNSPAALALFKDHRYSIMRKAEADAAGKQTLKTFLDLNESLLLQMLAYDMPGDLSLQAWLTDLFNTLIRHASDALTRTCTQAVRFSTASARTTSREPLEKAATEIAFLHDAFDGRKKIAALLALIIDKAGMKNSARLNPLPGIIARSPANSAEEKINDTKIAAVEFFIQADGLNSIQALNIYHQVTRSEHIAAEALLLFASLYWLLYYDERFTPLRPVLLSMFATDTLHHPTRQESLKSALIWHFLSPAKLIAIFLKNEREIGNKQLLDQYCATYRSVFSLKKRSELADQSLASYTAQFVNYRKNDLRNEAQKTAWLQLLLCGIDEKELTQPAKKIWYARHVNERAIRKAAVAPFPPLDGRENDLCIILTAGNNFIVSCTTEGVFAMRYFRMTQPVVGLQDLPCLRQYSARQLQDNLIPFHFKEDERSLEYFPTAPHSQECIIALNSLGSAPARWIRHSTLEISGQEKIAVYRFQEQPGQLAIVATINTQYQQALTEVAEKMEVIYNDIESTGEKILSFIPFGTIINEKIHDGNYPVSANSYAVESLFLLLNLTDTLNELVQGSYRATDAFIHQASRTGIRRATTRLLSELGKNAPTLAKKTALLALRAFNPLPFTELAARYASEKFTRFLFKNRAKRTGELLSLALSGHKEHLFDSIFHGQAASPGDISQPRLLHGERYRCLEHLLCWRRPAGEEDAAEHLSDTGASHSPSTSPVETPISSDSLPSLESYPSDLFDAPVEVQPAPGDRATLVADMQEQGMTVYGPGYIGLQRLPTAKMKEYAVRAMNLLPQVKSKIIKAITVIEKAKAGDEAIKRALYGLISPLINSELPHYIETVLNNLNARNKAINRLNITSDNLFFYQEREEVGMPRTVAFIHPRDAKRTIFINMANAAYASDGLSGSLIHELSHFAWTRDLIYLKNVDGIPDTLAGLQLNRDYNISYPEDTVRAFFKLSEDEVVTDSLRQQFLNSMDDPWWRTKLVANNADCHADIVMKIDKAFSVSAQGEVSIVPGGINKRSPDVTAAPEHANAQMLSGLIKLFSALVEREAEKRVQPVIF